MSRAASIFFILGVISLVMGLNTFGALSLGVGQIFLGLAFACMIIAVLVSLVSGRRPPSLN